MKKRLSKILWETDTAAVGVGLSCVMLIWAFVLLNPFATTINTGFYQPMRNFLFLVYVSAEVAELVWGLAYLCVGVTTLIGVFTNNTYSEYFLLPGIFILFFTAITLFRGSSIVPGPYLHFLFAVFMMWTYIRTRLLRLVH